MPRLLVDLDRGMCRQGLKRRAFRGWLGAGRQAVSFPNLTARAAAKTGVCVACLPRLCNLPLGDARFRASSVDSNGHKSLLSPPSRLHTYGHAELGLFVARPLHDGELKSRQKIVALCCAQASKRACHSGQQVHNPPLNLNRRIGQAGMKQRTRDAVLKQGLFSLSPLHAHSKKNTRRWHPPPLHQKPGKCHLVPPLMGDAKTFDGFQRVFAKT